MGTIEQVVATKLSTPSQTFTITQSVFMRHKSNAVPCDLDGGSKSWKGKAGGLPKILQATAHAIQCSALRAVL